MGDPKDKELEEEEDEEEEDNDDDANAHEEEGKRAVVNGNNDEESLKKRKRRALASSKSRRKRKAEYDALKDDNQRLREEKAEFEVQTKLLLEQVENKIPTVDVALKKENEMLRESIASHQAFIEEFLSLMDSGPVKVKNYQQAAQFGHDCMSYLLSKSQFEWVPVNIPSQLSLPFPALFCYMFTESFFDDDNNLAVPGSPSESVITNTSSVAYRSLSAREAKNNKMRFNIRADLVLPSAMFPRAAVEQALWEIFSQPEEFKRVFNVDSEAFRITRVKQIPDIVDYTGEEDLDSSLIFHRVKNTSTEMDMGTVILANRRHNVESMRSLLLPNEKCGVFSANSLAPSFSSSSSSSSSSLEKEKGIQDETNQYPWEPPTKLNQFGSVSTTVIAASTTTIASSKQFGEEVAPIDSVVFHGAICFDENPQTNRIIAIFSYPDVFKTHNRTYDQILTERGEMQDFMTGLLGTVFKEFQHSVVEKLMKIQVQI